MSTVDHAALCIFVAGFVFCTLAVIAPAPRDPAHGDNKMVGAILAALFAAAIAATIA